jgi:glycosyltransferase involved in cell wall biosynthesis
LDNLRGNDGTILALNIDETRTMNFIGELERRGFRVITFETLHWTDLIVRLYAYLRAVLRCDFIICGTRLPIQIPWMLLARALQRSCIIDCPMDITEWPFSGAADWKRKVKLALRSATCVLTIRSRAYLIAKFGLKPERVLFVDSCPDIRRIEAGLEARPHFRPPKGTFLLCWSGGHEHHRLERFMPTFQALVALMPNAELLVIADPAKYSVVETRRYAAAAGLSDRVHVLHVIKPPEEFYATVAQCHLWVATLGDDTLQGRHELRMELLEMGVLGKAVIAGSTPALIESGLTEREILYVDPADPEASALRIAKLAKNPGSLAQLGQNLRDRVLERFSLEGAVDDLLNCVIGEKNTVDRIS